MQLKQSMTGLWYVPLFVSSGASSSTPTIEWIYNDVAMRTMRADTSTWLMVNNGATGKAHNIIFNIITIDKQVYAQNVKVSTFHQRIFPNSIRCHTYTTS